MQQHNISIRGEFDVAVQKVGDDGQLVYSRDVLKDRPNLLTDTGMDALGTAARGSGIYGNNTWAQWCRVGTGNTPPAHGDTQLAAQVAVAPGSGSSSWLGTSVVHTVVYTFPAGSATGNIAEVGVSNTQGTELHTRALLTDDTGTPITVTVLSDEQLVITYRLVFTPAGDSVSTHTTSPDEQTYTVTARAAGVGFFTIQHSLPIGGQGTTANAWRYYHGSSSGIGPADGLPTGTMVTASAVSASAAPYIMGTYYRDITIIIPINAYNDQAIGAFHYIAGNPISAQIGIVPRLTKSAGETLKVTLRVSWSRE